MKGAHQRIVTFGGLRLGEAAALHAAAFPAPWEQRWDREALAELLAAPGAFGLMAQPVSEAVPDRAAAPLPAQGFVLARVAADEAEIITIAVAPQARRRGIGTALIEAATREAASRGAARLFLEVAEDNFPARRLYDELGFLPVGKRRAYYARGALPAVAALMMHRAIDAATA